MNFHPPIFDISAEALQQQAQDLVRSTQEATARLINSGINSETADFESVILPLAQIDNEIKARVQYLALFQAVSPSADLRKASSAAITLVDQTYLSLFRNESLFDLVNRVRQNPSSRARDEEDTRLLDKFHWMFVENGMHLTGSSRERFVWISRRLIELRVQFMETLGQDPGCLKASAQSLGGVPLDRLTVGGGADGGEGLYHIPLTRPNINFILSECRVPETRREVYLRSNSKYQANVGIFREIIILRDEASRLLGFPSFAARRLTQQMLGSPDRVDEFLQHLYSALKPQAEAEIRTLQELADTQDPIHLWDFDFYHARMLQEQNNVNHQSISEWFPARVTVQRMLGLYGELFGLQFEKIDVSGSAHTWHPDVDLFSVWEEAKSALIGYLYIDIFPRAGKYSHAANFNIHPSFLDTNGNRAPVVTALVCNVSQTQPALMRHNEIISVFHELGHGIHDLVGKSRYAMFHGHRTLADFTEAPSQLLEYWCWIPECLAKLSCHYSYVSDGYYQHWLGSRERMDVTRPPKEIPQSLTQDLGATKQLNQGILTLRQVAFSKFDMQIHHPVSHPDVETMDIADLYNRLLAHTTGLHGPENGHAWGHGFATTSHYVWGQEASYYSYLYTRTIAADIWSSCFKAAPMSREAGMNYRRQILNHGGSRDEHKAVQGLLGRASTADVYLQDLGCKLPTVSTGGGANLS
ncbi:thimet oligopeptidase [Aspergillus indologenus CBS 114.80]|uniref:Thimet oligopeptidase n=1 Tax=Aspergillus indologenus CBS 114.80 TaxID=1450541 RepID=A0A2V5HUI7_9EURO|nr:thimet oligopeptidase [Aspergillus indologenus CBS 114.80]